MKKRVSAWLVLMLTLAFAMPATGCSKFQEGEKIDETKTQITVSNYDGGIGSEWLQTAKARFEAKYADYEFEPGSGKKGVQVSVLPEETKGQGLQINAVSAHVVFQENVPTNQWKNYFEDISDVVTEKLTAYGEQKSIADKLTDGAKTVLGFGEDGKYYLLPHYEGFNGLQYDVTYFDLNEMYIAKNGGWTNLAGDRAAGPDGVAGNSDDGLPATHKEFIKLMDRIAQNDGAPLLWTGGFGDSYFNKLVEAFADAYLGKDNIELFYTFDSQGRKVEVITGFKGDGEPIIDNVEITEKTGYYVYQMAGRYYALQMAEKVLDNSAYAHRATTETSVSHLGAQEIFVFGKDELNSAPGYKPAAMLVEGNYWMNEAKDYIEEHDEVYDERTYAWMPLPTVLDGAVPQGTKHTMRDSLSAYGFVKKGIADENIKKAAKMFLQFCYTDESLAAFTVETGMTRNLEYDVDTSKLSTYAQSIWQYREEADRAEHHDLHNIYIANESAFDQFSWSSSVDGVTVRYPRASLVAGTSAQDYFTGMWVTPTNWDTNNRQWYTKVDQ